MPLPPKAINALLSFKELLSKGSDTVALDTEPVLTTARLTPGSRDGKEDKRKSHIMRHARQKGMSYQRYKQRGGW